MLKREIYFQDLQRGIGRGTLQGVIAATSSDKLTNFDAAVAYASGGGGRLLDGSLRSAVPAWKGCKKRWLLSIDYGRTEPDALEFLLADAKGDVRVFDGEYVVQRASFQPRWVFHPKLFFGYDDIEKPKYFGSFIGSGNLTKSGLVAGAECGVLTRWDSPFSGLEKIELHDARQELKWFEHQWAAATPVGKILKTYKKLRPKSGFPTEEDESASVKLSVSATGTAAGVDDALRHQSAKSLWTSPHRLTRNRGQAHPGNQVFFSRGAQVFFGFSPKDVPDNTEFGPVTLRIPSGKQYADRTVSFSDNKMVKITLPIPEEMGLGTFDDRYLVFTKRPDGSFLFEALSLPQFSALVKSAYNLVKRPMRSARETGWLW